MLAAQCPSEAVVPCFVWPIHTHAPTHPVPCIHHIGTPPPISRPASTFVLLHLDFSFLLFITRAVSSYQTPRPRAVLASCSSRPDRWMSPSATDELGMAHDRPTWHHMAGHGSRPNRRPSPSVQSGQPGVGGSPKGRAELHAGTRDGFRSPAVPRCESDGAPPGLVWVSPRRGHG